MRLFVGEWSKDDNGEEMQQKLKLCLCEELKSTAYLKTTAQTLGDQQLQWQTFKQAVLLTGTLLN